MSGEGGNVTYGTDQPPHTFTFKMYMGIMTCLIVFLIEFGNILTLVAACKFQKLRRKKYVLVISLALADCFVGLSGVILLLKFFDECNRNNVEDLIMDAFLRVPILSSIFHLVLMGMERFVAIMWPLRFETVVTVNTLKAGIAMCWIISFAVSLGYLGWIPQVMKYQATCLWQTVPLKFTLTLEFILYAIIFLFMALIYGKMLIIARNHARKIASKTRAQANPSLRNRPINSLFKGMNLILFLLTAYILAWMPYFVVYFLILQNGYTKTKNIMSMIVLHFGLTNSWLNTVIYGWTNKDFNEAYSRLLCCHNQQSPDWVTTRHTIAIVSEA